MSLFKILQILAVSGLLAGYSAWVRDRSDGPAVDLATPGQSRDCKIRLVTLAQARTLWRQRSTVFLDVRSATDFAYGHIKGAINLPWEDFQDGFANLKARLQKAAAIVVYCKSVDCGKSLWTAIRLREDKRIAAGDGDKRRADSHFNGDIPPPR